MKLWGGDALPLLATTMPAQAATYNVTDNCDVAHPDQLPLRLQRQRARQYVKNNAASVQYCSEVEKYRVYYNSGYEGRFQYFA